MRGVDGRTWVLVAALAGLLPSAAPSAMAGEMISLDQVPRVVRQAAAQAAPGARLSEAYRYVEDGKTYYELSGVDAQDRAVDVELTSRGAIISVETEVSIKDVPKVVVDAVKARTRGQKMTFGLVQVVTQKGRVVGYQFEGVNAEDDDVEVNVSADGQDVEIEIGD